MGRRVLFGDLFGDLFGEFIGLVQLLAMWTGEFSEFSDILSVAVETYVHIYKRMPSLW